MNKDTMKRLMSFAFTLVLAVGISSSVFAQNTIQSELIENGDFSNDSLALNWNVEGGANGTAAIVNGELALTGIADVTNIYDFQINQRLSALEIQRLTIGGSIEVSFDARTSVEDSSKTFHVFLGRTGGGWERFFAPDGDGLITVDTAMTTYTLTVESPEIPQDWINDGMRLGFEVAGDQSDLFLDNISVTVTIEDNIVIGGGFDGDTLGAPWVTAFDGGATADIGVVDGELAITNLVGATNTWWVQVFQEMNAEQLDSIAVGPYELIYEARTDVAEKTYVTFFGNNGTGGSWENFIGSVTIDSVMTQYSIPVNVTQTWANMKVGFEVGGSNSSIFIDNVVLRKVRDVPPPVPTFALSTADGIVTIDVTPVEGAASYNVYFSDEAIDTLTKSNVSLIATLDAETGMMTTHTTAAPHESLAFDFTAHYAVTASTEKGATSEAATSSIETGMSIAANYAVELSTEAIDAAFAAVDAEAIPEASVLAGFFPEGYTPFEISTDNQVAVVGDPITDNADVSGKFWIGFDALDNYMVIYAEIVDDSLVWASEATGSGGAWNFDSYEVGIGNYSPESFIAGSDHTTPEAGAEPDWQLRAGALTTDTGIRGFMHAYGYQGGTRLDGEIPNAVTLVENSSTGYRLFSLIAMSSLAATATEDAPWQFPTGTEVKTYPINFTVNDNDATSRDKQIAWGDKAQNGDWWQRPQQWNVIAFVGAEAIPTSNENEEIASVTEFKLMQNYPNPFNPTTNIQFNLATSSDVTLEVYNMLGQRVATLIKDEKMNAGSYTQSFDASNLASGMYVYRISTANFVQSRTMMLIK